MRVLQNVPLCHVCRKGVERCTEEIVWGRLRITAYCHGQTETVEVSESEANRIVFGEAFREPARLPPAAPV